MRIAHLGDIHCRGNSRHDEYYEMFSRLFDDIRVRNVDVIYIGGDIVHTKTQGITPELVDLLTWIFRSASSIAPLHMILGNHDGLVNNLSRQDAITPIVEAISSDRIKLYKKSGVYQICDGFNFCVFSMFDKDAWNYVKPLPGSINIALYHGAVRNASIDSQFQVTDADDTISLFDGFDFAFLADIHRQQFLNDKRTIAYCGSFPQQNYGESADKGYLLWDIISNHFDVDFVKIPNDRSFLTCNWHGGIEETVARVRDDARVFKNPRIKLRIPAGVIQSDVRTLSDTVRIETAASEVVVQHMCTDAVESDIRSLATSMSDVRNAETLVGLVSDFFLNRGLAVSSSDIDGVKSVIGEYVSRLNDDVCARNVKWSLSRLEFDNTFGYDVGNIIDFSRLRGIVGIFGKNRVGKSSIPGTLMYGLFNSSDRSGIRNSNIINTRKAYCRAVINLNAGETPCRIERQSVKTQGRKGELSSLTHLNLFVDGVDASIEQRRDTEKLLRTMIGSADDFLMTSLASQGDLNNFISHGAAQRKVILSHFLDLNVFDQLCGFVKDDAAAIRAEMQSLSDRDIDSDLGKKKVSLETLLTRRESLTKRLESARADLEKLQMIAAVCSRDNPVSKVQIADVQRRLKSVHQQIELRSRKIDALRLEKSKIEIDLQARVTSNMDFDIDDAQQKVRVNADLESHLTKLNLCHANEVNVLNAQSRSIKRLKSVPCGDMFPDCKFIRDCHSANAEIDSQREKVAGIARDIREAQSQLGRIAALKLSERIDQHQKNLTVCNQQRIDIAHKDLECRELSLEMQQLEIERSALDGELSEMKSKIHDDESEREFERVSRQIQQLQDAVHSLDNDRNSVSESIGNLSRDVEILESDLVRKRIVIDKWRVYEMLLTAFSKKGLPSKLIESYLPFINSELSKILSDVDGFSIELEIDANTNDIEIYLNYGDSRRVIECGSGMEKMLASIAIRIALINVSTLPKSDVLIIDEGFGVLDDSNIDLCGSLLQSLKKMFRVILIVTHVDSLKDIVDDVIDIERVGLDSHVACI